MDISKYPLEKLFHFVAGVIPGFTALLIFQLARPGSFGWFFDLGFLGYRTKLGLIMLAAFVIGNSMAIFFSAFLACIGGALGGGIAALRPLKPSHSYDTGPWRDPLWRNVLKTRLAALGVEAPNDTSLISEEVFNIRRETINLLPVEYRDGLLRDLISERFQTQVDDSQWAQWYGQYHMIVLQPDDRDLLLHVQRGFNLNLQTTAACILISAVMVPGLRHWWCILPAVLWLLLLILELYRSMYRYTKKWMTLPAQIAYLAEGGSRTQLRALVP